MTIRQINIITWGGIGDVILLTPALKRLKNNEQKVLVKVLCVSQHHKDVLIHNPHVDVLSLAGFRSAPLEMLRLFYRRTIRRGPGYFHPNYGGLRPSLYYRIPAYVIIAEILGVTLSSDMRPEIFLTSAEEGRAQATLRGVNNPVLIHTTAACSANKEWPSERWVKLVRQNPDLTFCQVGARTDEAVLGCLDLRGGRLRDSFALIKHAKAFIGIDSGLAHACAAFDTPGIVLFGPSTPAVWGHAHNVNLWGKACCSPCIDLLAGDPCPYDKGCMLDISVQQVEQALRSQARVAQH
jgi:ADP-heptose:LPS heptosyltransferase